MNKIIAIIGMCGSGKSEAVKFFEKNGYKKVYFGGVVLDEMKRLDLEVNEENERKTREDLRKEFGMGAMAFKSIDQINDYYRTGNVVIESLYSWEEFKIIKKKYGDAFKLLAVYTTKALRYERLAKREFRPLTNEQALSRDYAELEKLDKGAPIAFADFTVINDGTLTELNKHLEKYL
jgi:dephospho-CoA kinase